jgi:hypothetical protein
MVPGDMVINNSEYCECLSPQSDIDNKCIFCKRDIEPMFCWSCKTRGLCYVDGCSEEAEARRFYDVHRKHWYEH